jgi:hypothetical protein
LRELPTPIPHGGEALIRVHTSGLNFVDVYFRAGKYKAPLPFIPDGEGSGHVEALGEGVADLSVGDALVFEAVDSSPSVALQAVPSRRLACCGSRRWDTYSLRARYLLTTLGRINSRLLREAYSGCSPGDNSTCPSAASIHSRTLQIPTETSRGGRRQESSFSRLVRRELPRLRHSAMSA